MKAFHYRQSIAAGLLCCVVQQVGAGELASEQGYLEEFPVVLSASRLLQPVSEAPSAISVIDRNMIIDSGFRKIPDLFKLVPGMYVSYYKGSQAIVSYHGTSDQYARRMQVLIDGRSVYLAPFSDVDWESLPIHIDDIERIEVVRGPSAAAHGANSLQGVINIITRDAGARDGTTVSAIQGNKGISDVSAHVGRRGAQLDYRLTLGYRSDNGYDPRYDLLNNDMLSNDSSATRWLNLRANYHPNLQDNFDIQIGASNGVRGGGFTDSPLNTPHDQLIGKDFQQLTWLHALNSHDEVQLRYYHIRHRLDEMTTSNLAILTQMSLPQFTLSDSNISDRHELEVQHTMHNNGANRLVWGAAYRTDYVEAANYFAAPLRQNDYRLFFHDEWRISKDWILNGGAMLENSGLGSTDLSPKVALTRHVAPGHTMRVGMARAYRNPAMLEQQGDWRYPLPQNLQQAFGIAAYPIMKSSGGLQPEQVVSEEAGYLGKSDNGRLSVDLRVFRDQYRNIIIPDNSTSPPGFGNATTPLWQSGAEASIEYRPVAQTRIMLNYSHSRISTDLNGYQGNMPEEQFSLMLARKMGEYSVLIRL